MLILKSPAPLAEEPNVLIAAVKASITQVRQQSHPVDLETEFAEAAYLAGDEGVRLDGVRDVGIKLSVKDVFIVHQRLLSERELTTSMVFPTNLDEFADELISRSACRDCDLMFEGKWRFANIEHEVGIVVVERHHELAQPIVLGKILDTRPIADDVQAIFHAGSRHVHKRTASHCRLLQGASTLGDTEDD